MALETSARPARPRSLVQAAGETAVIVLALTTLLDLGLEFLSGRPAGWLWVDLRWMPPAFADLLRLLFAATVLASTRLRGWARLLPRAVVLLVGGLCLADGVRYQEMLARGVLADGFPVPVSFAFALLLIWWALRPERVRVRLRWSARLGYMAFGGVMVTVGTLACALAFGATDYRRPADAIVVFGAKVNPDGSPSLSLADRTRTACRLYHEGLAPRIVLSGGHGLQAPICETVAMRDLALSLGVPDEALILDDQGVNTLATVRNAGRLAHARGWRSLLMVSHDYHLARIKLFSERIGPSAVTVPADETRPITRYPWFVIRETAALLYWYCHPATFGS